MGVKGWTGSLGSRVWVVRDGQGVKGLGIVGRSLNSVIAVKTSTGWLDCKHSDCIPLNEAENRKYSYLFRRDFEEEDASTVTKNYLSKSHVVIDYTVT